MDLKGVWDDYHNLFSNLFIFLNIEIHIEENEHMSL